jgi:YbbR domain-containing protein
MKEKLTRNIGLKVLSVILAAILWLVITNVDDPVKTRDFTNVTVEILHEDAITALDQVYEVLEGQTIDFTVAARRSIADKLTSSDFRVTADFAKLSDVYAVTINITCPRYADDVTVTDGLYQVMKVNLEDLEEKHYKVNVVQKGEPAEGYYISEKTANTILRVSGPKSKMERIKDVIVEVDVTEISGPFRTTEEPKAMDEEGLEIDASNLSFSEPRVTINIEVYKTKKIDLQIIATGEPAKGYVMTDIEYEPKKIEVAGERDVLEKINSLSFTENITGARKKIEKEISLQEQLGEGIILVGENQTAVINITIEKEVTKELTIWPGDIKINNLLDALDLTYLTTGPITISVAGPAKEIAELTRTSLKPYIELSNYSSGTYTVEIGVELSPHMTLANSPTVSVYLTKID